MKTTADFLDDLRARHGLPSDGKLALHMGWQRAQLTRYRQKRETFSDDTAIMVGAQLGIEPDYIMACMAMQRAKSPETRRAWERIARRLAPAAAALLLWIGLTPSPAPASVLHNQNVQDRAAIHICANWARRLLGRALARLSALARTLGTAFARWQACDDFPRD